jgi:hypothetical protein
MQTTPVGDDRPAIVDTSVWPADQRSDAANQDALVGLHFHPHAARVGQHPQIEGRAAADFSSTAAVQHDPGIQAAPHRLREMLRSAPAGPS